MFFSLSFLVSIGYIKDGGWYVSEWVTVIRGVVTKVDDFNYLDVTV